MKLSDILEKLVEADKDFKYVFVMEQDNTLVVKGNGGSTVKNFEILLDAVAILADVIATDEKTTREVVLNTVSEYLGMTTFKKVEKMVRH